MALQVVVCGDRAQQLAALGNHAFNLVRWNPQVCLLLTDIALWGHWSVVVLIKRHTALIPSPTALLRCLKLLAEIP